MFCNWQQDRGRYVCQNCGAKRRKQVRRVCPGKSKKRVRRAVRVSSQTADNIAPLRPEPETLYILANHCYSCDYFRPAVDDKPMRCTSCGCSSTDFRQSVERTLFRCPKSRRRGARRLQGKYHGWTNDEIQRQFAQPPQDLGHLVPPQTQNDLDT